MTEKNRTRNLFNENQDKFKTKRQASKYLNEYGSVYKNEKNIPLEFSKRGAKEVSLTPKSHKNISKKRKAGKK